tara:strand:+ start:24 stop:191 length:168 start_codon:yes stop_codon:yes gene_type:complete
MTGWEKSDKLAIELTQDIVKEANFRYQSFITWEEYTLAFIRKVFVQKGFEGKYYA